jgi:hypothetical protein
MRLFANGETSVQIDIDRGLKYPVVLRESDLGKLYKLSKSLEKPEEYDGLLKIIVGHSDGSTSHPMTLAEVITLHNGTSQAIASLIFKVRYDASISFRTGRYAESSYQIHSGQRIRPTTWFNLRGM